MSKSTFQGSLAETLLEYHLEIRLVSSSDPWFQIMWGGARAAPRQLPTHKAARVKMLPRLEDELCASQILS